MTERLLRETARLAERHDCALHTHLAETADETRFCEARYGCRPVDLLERNGWLVPGALVVVERSARGAALVWPEGYTSGKDRSYGDTALWFGHAGDSHAADATA